MWSAPAARSPGSGPSAAGGPSCANASRLLLVGERIVLQGVGGLVVGRELRRRVEGPARGGLARGRGLVVDRGVRGGRRALRAGRHGIVAGGQFVAHAASQLPTAWMRQGVD